MKKIILTIFFSVIANFTVFSQWFKTDGPNGAYAEEIVKVGSVLILSTGNGGVYKSIDNGNSWELSNSGIPCNEGVRKLLEYNGLLYASITRSGVYMSEDEGENWIPINSGIETLTFYSLMVNGSDIYAGNSEGGVYYSPDNGANWLDKSTGVSDILFLDFVIFNSKVYAGGSLLYETSNNGDTWTSIEIVGLGPNGVRSMLTKDNVFYVGDDNTVFVTTDNLASWNDPNLNTAASIVSMDSTTDRVYCTTSFGRYFYTLDNGVNWILVQNTNTNTFANHVLFSDPKIIMSTQDGLFESLDTGINWSINNIGLNALQIESLNYNSTYLFAGTDRQGIFRSPNDGQSWTRINNGLSDMNANHVSEIITIGNVIYIATDDGVYVSVNNGDSWVNKFDPGANHSAQVLDFNNGVFAVGVNGSGVYLSSDSGETWSLTETSGLNVNTSYESIMISGNTIAISTANAEIYISEDLGNTWTNISIPNGNNYTLDLQLVNNELYAATVSGLFISDNLGMNWTSYNNDSKIIENIIVEQDKIYAATSTGVYITNDCNVKWYPICEGIGSQWINKIMLKDDKIFAGTFASGVWQRLKPEMDLILAEICPFNSISLCTNSTLVDLFENLNGNPNIGGSWNPSLSSDSGIFDPAIDSSGIYTYYYTEESDFCECEIYAKVEVNVVEALNAGDDGELSICVSSDTVDLFDSLNGNPDFGGTWSPNLLSGTGIFDPGVDDSGIYIYTVTNENCDEDVSVVNVTVEQEPNAGLDSILTLCTNDSIVDLLTILGGNPDSDGIWSPSLMSGTSMFDPAMDSSGIYTYTVSNSRCEAVSEVEATVFLEPNSGTDGELSVCVNSGNVNLFDGLGGSPNLEGIWSPVLVSGTGEFDPLLDSAGIYIYTIENNCGSESSNVSVSILNSYETPSYEITVIEFSNNNSITVNINAESLYEYSLDGIIFQSSNVFTNLLGGIYTVFGREIYGCGFFQKDIAVIGYPKFFTPNGDGYNDYWQIKGVNTQLRQSSEIFIYDRYGKLLKQLPPSSIGWDGTLNSEKLPTNDYWFVVYLGNEKSFNGHFTLKR